MGYTSMKKSCVGLFSLALMFTAQADMVRLTNGQSLAGRVADYADDSFEVLPTNAPSIKIPAPQVVSIDFSRGAVPATVESAGQSPAAGSIWLYARGAFNFDNDKGETTKIPLTTVSHVTFSDQPLPERAPPPPRPKPARTWSDPYATPSAPKVEIISRGEPVDIQKHCVPGGITIVDFYADWCGPCRQAGPIIEERVNQDPNLFLRKINIVSWTSPVSKQYGVRSIPFIQVYDSRGIEVGHLNGFSANALDYYINQARDH